VKAFELRKIGQSRILLDFQFGKGLLEKKNREQKKVPTLHSGLGGHPLIGIQEHHRDKAEFTFGRRRLSATARSHRPTKK
jgi:hypothetical protein